MSDNIRHRLPILGTISRTFFFVFQDIGPIIRLTWFPLLIVAAVQGWAFDFQVGRLIEGLSTNRNPATLFSGRESVMIIAAFFVALFSNAVAMVAVLRIVLFGDRKPSAYIHFAIGKAEFYVFLFPILLMLVAFFAMLLLSMAGTGLEVFRADTGMVSTNPMLDGSMGRIAIVPFAILAIIIWILVRISLYAPSIVARQRIDLDEIVGVTRWRFLPLFAVYFVSLCLFFLFWWILFEAIQSTGMTSGEMAAEILQQYGGQGMQARMIGMLQFMRDAIIAAMAFFYVTSIIYTAFIAGLTGFAYRALKGVAPDQRMQE